MNNLLKSAALLLAGLGFAACSSEVAGPDAPVIKNGTAYLAVNIQYANGGTRALSANYENAVKSEREVQSADFYFYDEAGNYITHAKPQVTSEGGDLQNVTDRVQFGVANVLVLHDLEEEMPSRMMCVINQPTGLDLKGQPFDFATQKVADYAVATPNAFIMSSAAFENNTGGVKNVGVKLESTDFMSELLDADHDNHPTTKVKDIYVERIAAKFNVGYGEDLEPVSDDLSNVFEIATFNVDGGDVALYAKIEGWGLNVTAKEYNLYKKVTNGAGYFPNWSDADIRSYWGEVPFYGNTDDVHTAYAKNEAEGDGDKAAQVVEYYPWSSLTKTIGQPTTANDPNYSNYYAYAAPNTNTLDVINGHYTNRATNVLVAARVCKADGTNVELVNYGGALLTKDAFIVSILNKYGLTELWKKTSEDGVTPETYEQIGNDDITFTNVGDGVGSFTIATPAGGWLDKDGEGYVATAKTAEIADAQKETAEVYEEGMMYYTIPVAHNLGVTAPAWNMATFAAALGHYGVVRNHSYQLTITKIANLGHAVLDPDKDIVPNDEDAKRFYLLSTINVLAWRTVTQNVAL